MLRTNFASHSHGFEKKNAMIDQKRPAIEAHRRTLRSCSNRPSLLRALIVILGYFNISSSVPRRVLEELSLQLFPEDGLAFVFSRNGSQGGLTGFLAVDLGPDAALRIVRTNLSLQITLELSRGCAILWPCSASQATTLHHRSAPSSTLS